MRAKSKGILKQADDIARRAETQAAALSTQAEAIGAWRCDWSDVRNCAECPAFAKIACHIRHRQGTALALTMPGHLAV